MTQFGFLLTGINWDPDSSISSIEIFDSSFISVAFESFDEQFPDIVASVCTLCVSAEAMRFIYSHYIQLLFSQHHLRRR
jgi:hypothetical protein